MRNHIS